MIFKWLRGDFKLHKFLKLTIGSQSIVSFVDLVEANKKVYEAFSPRSLLGFVEVFKESN